MRPTDKKWTEEDVNQLKALFYKGILLKNIAPIIGRTFWATRAKTIKLELKRHDCKHYKDRIWNDEKEQIAIQMFQGGYTYEQIAETIELSKTSVSKHLLNLGFRSERSKHFTENLQLKTEGLRRCPICKKIKPRTKDHFRQINNRNYGCIDCLIANDDAFWTQKIKTLYRRCKKNNTLCNIDIEDLKEIYKKQEGKCFYTGEELYAFGAGRQDRSLSVDRIIPEKGYTRNNIVLCCFIINHMKYTQTLEGLFYWAKAINDNKENIEKKIKKCQINS